MKFGWCADRHHVDCRARVTTPRQTVLVCDCDCHKERAA